MFQLVYTSAPSGLAPGRSGFCTVARHREIPERLAAALEKISVYEPPPEHGRAPIFSFRAITSGNENFGVISRYCDAGLDYTSRRNSLAHHLIFAGGEMSGLPPPAEIARRFSGWISLWNEPARFLSGDTALPADLLKCETKLPAATWQKISSDAGNAARLCPSGMQAETAIARDEVDDETVLKLFAEASLLVRGGAWSAGWTTCIQKTDTVSHMPWQGVPPGVTGSAEKISPSRLGTAQNATPAVRYARTGVSPDKQPKAGGVPAFGAAHAPIKMPPAKHSGARVDNVAGNNAKFEKSKIFLFAGVALLVAGVACFGLWLFLKNKNSAGNDVPPPPGNPSAPAISGVAEKPQSFSTIYSGETLRREIQTAISNHDWIKAGEAWKKLSAESPDVAGAHKDEFLPLIRAQLAGALSEKLQTQFAALAPEFSAGKIAALKKDSGSAKALLDEFKASVSPENRANFSRLEKQIELLEILPKTPPVIVFSAWKKSSGGSEKPVRSFVFTAKSLREFLGLKHAEITLTVVALDHWSEIESGKKNAQTLKIPADKPGNFIQKKKLFVNTASAGAPSIYFEIEKGDRIKITHAVPAIPATLDELFLNKKSFSITFAETGKKRGAAGKPATLAFIAPEAPPRPFRATADLLEYNSDAGTLSIPAWLAGALKQRFGDMQPVLYPAKSAGTSAKKNYTTAVVSRETVINAIRQENVFLENEIAALKKRIAALKEQRQTAEDAAPIDKDLSEAQKTLEIKTVRQRITAKEAATAGNRGSGMFAKDYAPWIIGLRGTKDAAGSEMPVIILE